MNLSIIKNDVVRCYFKSCKEEFTLTYKLLLSAIVFTQASSNTVNGLFRPQSLN